jgi:stress response protein SCP2
MGGVGELYGSHALWDLQIITVDMDAVPLSAVAITLQVNSYEAEGGGSMTYSWFPGLNTLTYYLGAQSSITSLFKFRSSDAPGFPSNVRLIAANIVGQKWYVTAAGYVYDERLI